MEKIWLKSYPKIIPHEVDFGNYRQIMDVFDESIRKFRSLNSFTNMGTTLTYHDLDVLVGNFSSFLQHELQLKKGDRIAIQMPNLLQFPIALFAALRLGLVVVNTNPLYTAHEMQHQLKDSGAKAIVILANYAHLLEKIISQTDIQSVVVTEVGDLLNFPKGLVVNAVLKHVKKMVPDYKLPQAYRFRQALELGSTKAYHAPQIGLDDLAFLQYTGGTTGVSKGAMLTHKNILGNMLQIYAWMLPLLEERKEMVVTALPMYHIFSLTVNTLSFLRLGAENILITNPKDIQAFIAELRKYPFTVTTGVNTLFNALMNHKDFAKINFSRCKLHVAGAMALQTAVAERWYQKTKTKIYEGYGLTEASPVVCCNPIDNTDIVGTIGLPLPSTQVILLDDDNMEVPMGHPGELCVKGPQVMKGYWNQPQETDKVFYEGWLRTGDIAIASENGFFKIVDRKKDMILVSGFNVYPNEIEDVVIQHPGVLEVAAVGVPDEKSGEVVKIFVVKKDPTLLEKDLIEHCRENLTGYKIPKFIEFRKELPKTNVGKILRRALRQSA
jgi:long-chain acyl-CoA synthetase